MLGRPYLEVELRPGSNKVNERQTPEHGTQLMSN